MTSTGLPFAKRSSVYRVSPLHGYGSSVGHRRIDSLFNGDYHTLTGATDDVSIVAFGVSGANTTTPWDTNAALPAVASSTSSSVPTATEVSTSSVYDMILGFEGDWATGTESKGARFTLTAHNLNTSFVDQEQATAEYNVASTTQSSILVAFSATRNHLLESDWRCNTSFIILTETCS